MVGVPEDVNEQRCKRLEVMALPVVSAATSGQPVLEPLRRATGVGAHRGKAAPAQGEYRNRLSVNQLVSAIFPLVSVSERNEPGGFLLKSLFGS